MNKRIVTFFVFLTEFACFAGFSGCAGSSSSEQPPPQDTSKTKPPTRFTNPLLSKGPDPWVIRKNGYYYYMSTMTNRIGIRKTKYMANLKKAPLAIVWYPPKSGPNARRIWAPELHYIHGNWYLYYSASPLNSKMHHLFVLENRSKDPTTGSWTDKGRIADPEADHFAIDGTVFKYHKDHYLLWKGHASTTDNTSGIYIARMKNPWTLGSARVLITTPTYAWEGRVNEGPEILKNKKGQVFLIFSAMGCGTDNYKLGMVTLKKGGDPLNPSDWTKDNEPLFTKYPAHHAYGPGHNGFFKSPDGTENWIIYHANPKSGQGCDGHRSPRIQKFTWNEDGTPNFGRPVDINTPIPVPSRGE